MTGADRLDLTACHRWRKSARLGPARVGIIPEWNAVTLLNPAAAAIWDLLVETGDAGAVAARYARDWPDRADMAAADVAACLDAWARQGLFHAPAPSPEQERLGHGDSGRAAQAEAVHFRRTISVAGVATTVEIADPTLARVIEDLLVDFPDADTDAPAPTARTLRSTGPHGGWYLFLDGTPVRLAQSLVEARGQIVSEMVRLAGRDAGWLATAHGAVLTGPSGCVFLAGASGAGKSTLSAGLVALGWQILAEDIAAFDAGLEVCPMPFALSIKQGALCTLADAFPTLARARVHQLGPRRVRYQGLPGPGRADRPERPRLVLDVRYDPGMDAEAATLQPLSPIDSLSLFMNEESYIAFERDDAGDFLGFVERTPAYAIRYGSIAAAERSLRERLDWHRP